MARKFANFFATKLKNDIDAVTNTIALDTLPRDKDNNLITAGRVVIEARNSDKREIVKYTGIDIGTTALTGCTRGDGKTTATTHSKGAITECNVTGEDLSELYQAFEDFAVTNSNGWTPHLTLPTTIAYQGNGNYLWTFVGTDVTPLLGRGMKVRGTRTVAAPTRAALFNGSTQSLTKSTPNKLSFTDNFTLFATGKITSYPSGNNKYLLARMDAAAANGYGLFVTPEGYFGLWGVNGGAGNWRLQKSYVRVPLNRDFKIRGTWAAGVVNLYLDGQLVQSAQTTSGTAPTTIAQGTGSVAIGKLGDNTTANFPGEVSQAAIFDAALTVTQIRAIDSQGIVGNETNLKSAWSLNNNLLDLMTTTPNDLTNNNAVTFPVSGGFGNNGASASLEYGMITSTPVFSGGNTTFEVQAVKGCMFPTTATPLSALHYSPHAAPFNFPQNPTMLSGYQQSGQNTNIINPGNGSFNLDSSGACVGIFCPFDMIVDCDVQIGVGSSGDFEFGVSVRDNGAVGQPLPYFQPHATIGGGGGGRATVRGGRFSIAMTKGYHIVAVGLETAVLAGGFIQTSGARITVNVPAPIMA